ncbi:PP2C family protein-serine/threonine phosphatase [Streptomonospora litoralis]|uniref:Serine/threonine phosphatase stp n=1 Tax=Streptomonospora litoralis TaxID=2498135 RepID=A0A4P6Q6I8_9ACTN|nr:hypothetical protein [Streptomonospora litoralis]QBI56386.1 Serine/threonine phosphatase stp [Streptomonospora litoralis]
MLTCPMCGDAVAAEDFFCEHCGHGLRSTGHGAHPAGGAGATGPADGMRRRAPADHSELRVGRAAGVSDRGLRHEYNEDAMAVRVVGAAADAAAGPAATVAAVVCDGVSTSPRPEAAAGTAAQSGCAALTERLEGGADTAAALGAAVRRADHDVAALAPSAAAAPACTFLAAAVPPRGPLGVGWVGDSRAYWVSASARSAPSAQLTSDDSWSAAMVAMSLLSPEEAARSPRAHALTAWLGADYGGTAGRVATFDPGGAGSLVLCSDGLWNLVPDPVELAALVRGGGPDPLAAARSCVRFALERGGHDNVTVVVVTVPGGTAQGVAP